MVKELTFDENGTTKTIKVGPKALSFMERHSVAMDDLDSVAGHDELLIIWPAASNQYSEMVDDAIKTGIMDSYSHLDKHVVIRNI